MKKNIFKLSKPFTFEGETYTELNLSELEDITGQQLYEVEKIFKKQEDFELTSMDAMEYDLNYIFILCSFALKKPIEFFKALPATDVVKLKYRTIRFLAGSDIEESKETL